VIRDLCVRAWEGRAAPFAAARLGVVALGCGRPDGRVGGRSWTAAAAVALPWWAMLAAGGGSMVRFPTRWSLVAAGPAEFVARPTVTWIRGSPPVGPVGQPLRQARNRTGREVLVLKGYDEVAVFLGLDVGKQGHHAVAQDRSGN
jgi:hypothetical protein